MRGPWDGAWLDKLEQGSGSRRATLHKAQAVVEQRFTRLRQSSSNASQGGGRVYEWPDVPFLARKRGQHLLGTLY